MSSAAVAGNRRHLARRSTGANTYRTTTVASGSSTIHTNSNSTSTKTASLECAQRATCQTLITITQSFMFAQARRVYQ
jgi:hypothetical protein